MPVPLTQQLHPFPQTPILTPHALHDAHETALQCLLAQQCKDKDTAKRPNVRFCTYNIRNGRNSGLASACRMLDKTNIGLAFLTETKITNDIYTKLSSGYSVLASKAVSYREGGVALTIRDAKHWHVESTRIHGPNVMSWTLVSGTDRTPMVGAYLAPKSLKSLPDLIAALEHSKTTHPGVQPVVIGDLNIDLTNLTKPRNNEVAAVLSTYGLEDMLPHFRQRESFRHNKTWFQVRKKIMYRSRCDCILASDHCKIPKCLDSGPVELHLGSLHASGRVLHSGPSLPQTLPPGPQTIPPTTDQTGSTEPPRHHVADCHEECRPPTTGGPQTTPTMDVGNHAEVD